MAPRERYANTLAIPMVRSGRLDVVPRQAGLSLNLSVAQRRYLVHAFLVIAMVAIVTAGTFNGASDATGSPTNIGWGTTIVDAKAIVAPVMPSTRDGRPDTEQLPRFALLGPVGGALDSTPQTPAPNLRAYTVQTDDNPFDLAQNFGISEETLLAANGLTGDSLITIGQKLLVPPVNGVIVTTQPGDSVAGLADQWKIDPVTMRMVNGLAAVANPLTPGSPLVLPNVQPPVSILTADQPAAAPKDQANPAPSAAAAPAAANVLKPINSTAPAQPIIDRHPAVSAASSNKFPYGQCTWWAAQSRPDIGAAVIGNAASWLYAARAAGLPTGTVPRVGAVVVYQPGSQGASWVGHVAYVTSVSADGVHFSISEMNYAGWAVVSHRASYAGPGVGFIY